LSLKVKLSSPHIHSSYLDHCKIDGEIARFVSLSFGKFLILTRTRCQFILHLQTDLSKDEIPTEQQMQSGETITPLRFFLCSLEKASSPLFLLTDFVGARLPVLPFFIDNKGIFA